MFKKILLSIAVLALALPATALAQTDFSDVQPVDTPLTELIQTIINWVLGVVVLLAVGMIIYGGIQMMTSQGDPEKFSKGQSIVIYAVIGLIVALIAWSIVNWVRGSILGL